MKSKEKLSSMKSMRFDGIYTAKEAEVGHGGGCVHIYIYTWLYGFIMMFVFFQFLWGGCSGIDRSSKILCRVWQKVIMRVGRRVLHGSFTKEHPLNY